MKTTMGDINKQGSYYDTGKHTEFKQGKRRYVSISSPELSVLASIRNELVTAGRDWLHVCIKQELGNHSIEAYLQKKDN